MWILISLLSGLILFSLVIIIGKYFSISHKFSTLYSVFAFEYKELSFEGNYLLNVLFPSAYIAIMASVWQRLGLIYLIKNIWIVIVAFWVIRYIYYILILNRFNYLNFKYEAISSTLSIAIGYSIYYFFINKLLEENEQIFIPLIEFRNAIWYAIIAFVTSLCWRVIKVTLSEGYIYPKNKKAHMIKRKYTFFKKRYDDYINSCIKEIPNIGKKEINRIIALIYAIMIYEDYNRPKTIRNIESIIKFFCPNRIMTLGLMQIKTAERLTDLESIDLAVKKICNAIISDQGLNIRAAIYDYNNGEKYFTEVYTIYEHLINDCT